MYIIQLFDESCQNDYDDYIGTDDWIDTVWTNSYLKDFSHVIVKTDKACPVNYRTALQALKYARSSYYWASYIIVKVK